MRLAKGESARIAELRERLGTWVDEGPSPWRDVVATFAELTGADQAVCFAVATTLDGCCLTRSHDVGFKVGFRATFNEMLSANEGQYSGASLIVPAPDQCNLALAMPSFGHFVDASARSPVSPFGTGATDVVLSILERNLAYFHRLGIGRQAQVRVLLADGGDPLGWFGGFRSEPFGDRECAILRALVPALAKRLRLERRLDRAGLDHAAAIDVFMARLTQAAFIVSGSGKIVHCNKAGRALLDRERKALSERLRRAIRASGQPHERGDVCVTSFGPPGQVRHHLVTFEDYADPSAKLDAAEARWQLTSRQRSVLEHVAVGASNAQVAASLGLSERTVEIHVSALLARSGAAGRAELVARFWRTLA